MLASARLVTTDDDPRGLIELYVGLEREMAQYHPMWHLADGWQRDPEFEFGQAVSNPDGMVIVGEIDSYPLGFLVTRLVHKDQVGMIELIYTDPQAREVGVGEAMLDLALTQMRSSGLTLFDAPVLPGHRVVKNFFESAGFSARSIIMHHNDLR